MSHSIKLIKDSSIYLISNIFVAAIPFLLLPLLTRYLTQEEYGQIGIFQSIISGLTAIVGFNSVGAFVRKMYDFEEDSPEVGSYLASCLQILIVSILIIFGLLFFFIDGVSKLINVDTKWVLFAILISGFNFVMQLLLGIFQVKRKAVKYGFIQSIYAVLNGIITIVLVVILNMGADGRVDAVLFSSLSIFLIAIFIFVKYYNINIFVFKKHHIYDALKFGVPLIPHVAGIYLLGSFDRIVLSDLVGLDATAVYVVSFQIVSVMGIVFDSLNKAFVPRLYLILNKNEIYNKLRVVKFTYLWFFIISVVVLFFFITGSKLIELIAGSVYSNTGYLSGFVALGFGFTGMYMMVTNYVFYTRKTALLSLVTIVSGAFNVLLLYTFIEYYGVIGAAYAFSLSMFIRFLLTWWLAIKFFPMPWFKFKYTI